ncbi:glycine oxidase ThiO [Actinopolymorpha rutila]|uniref:glycine oxidase n=1 Tax=Actinopolymorpha rutila TaxID=446787 RepID=A0A852ZDK9_9ACTN|nr:glycine oxidase ThiO [Actinopolymorpha rutila]NYH90393.1 glycine oxidase [Actinopolymorpha rutila]
MRVAVLGAGVIGLACAAELLRAGHDVHVFDPAPASGATHAAAGMLSPAGEAWHGEGNLLRLGVESAGLWPEYAAWLEFATGVDVGHRRAGTLLVGRDHDDVQVVHRILDVLAAHGIAYEELRRREMREREPELSTRVVGGAYLPGDHSVNPRRVATALLALLGDRVERCRAVPSITPATTPATTPASGDASAGSVDGVRTEDGRLVPADAVLVATGHRLPPQVPQHRHVRPVLGEILRIRLPTGQVPIRTVRAVVHGEPVYVVPRADGEVVVGATQEEHAGEPMPTVGGVARLLDAARTLVPGLERAEILEVLARHRPGTPDNGPLLGPTGVAGLFLAAGHHRGGVLLAPVTARILRTHIESAGQPRRSPAAEASSVSTPDAANAFSPNRFDALDRRSRWTSLSTAS